MLLIYSVVGNRVLGTETATQTMPKLCYAYLVLRVISKRDVTGVL